MNMRAYDKLSKHLICPTMGVALNQLWKTCLRCESMVRKTKLCFGIVHNTTTKQNNGLPLASFTHSQMEQTTSYCIVGIGFGLIFRAHGTRHQLMHQLEKDCFGFHLGNQPINPSFGVTNLAPTIQGYCHLHFDDLEWLFFVCLSSFLKTCNIFLAQFVSQ